MILLCATVKSNNEKLLESEFAVGCKVCICFHGLPVVSDSLKVSPADSLRTLKTRGNSLSVSAFRGSMLMQDVVRCFK